MGPIPVLSPPHGPLQPRAPPMPSAGEGWHYMDVLPERAGKHAAARYVARLLPPPLTAVVSGDAPNDLDMLQVGRPGG